MSEEYVEVAVTSKEIEGAMAAAKGMIRQKIDEGNDPAQVRKHSLVFAMGIILQLAADENFAAVEWALAYLKKVIGIAEPQILFTNAQAPEKPLLN